MDLPTAAGVPALFAVRIIGRSGEPEEDTGMLVDRLSATVTLLQ